MYGSVQGEAFAVIYFILFQCSGILAALHVLKTENVAVKLLFGSVFGSVMLQWLPVIFAFPLGFTVPAHIVAGIIAAGLAGFCLIRLNKKGNKLIRGDLSKTVARHPFVLVIIALFVFYIFLVQHGLTITDGKVFSSQGTFGDMSMHLSFITSIARQGTFPPHYSILPEAQLSYPFLADSISSSLYLFGAPLKLAYALPMIFAAFQVMAGFYIFAYNWLKSKLKAAFAFLMFFFCGGFGFIYFMNEGGLSRILNEFYQTPTNYVQENVRWVNVVVDMMLPQRATLFGWAVLIPVMYLLQKAVFEERRNYSVPAAVLTGLLPMIHTHSFLFIAMYSVMLVIAGAVRKLKNADNVIRISKLVVAVGMIAVGGGAYFIFALGLRDSQYILYAGIGGVVLFLLAMLSCAAISIKKDGFMHLFGTWGAFLIIVCILALPQLFIWTFKQSQHFIRPYFNWANEGDSFVLFYLKNIGLTAVLSVLAILFAKKDNFLKVSPVFFAWFVAEFIQFQPNNYDNNKLIYPAFMLLCCISADFLTDIIQKIKLKSIRVPIYVATTIIISVSAVLTMAREANSSYEIFGTDATEAVAFMETQDTDATVMTSTRHNNEIASLSGRNIVCGSASYLFFHGLHYYVAEEDVREFYENPTKNEDILEKRSVDFIMVSPFEKDAYKVRENEIAAKYPVAFQNGTITLYEVE